MAKTATSISALAASSAQLELKLYNFGLGSSYTAALAGKPLNQKRRAYLRRTVRAYTKHLNELALHLTQSEPVTGRMEETVREIYDQSSDVFSRIESRLPGMTISLLDSKSGEDSFLRRGWSRADIFIVEIEVLQRRAMLFMSMQSNEDTESPQILSSTPETNVAAPLFVHYTISEDRTGTNESIMSERLAALGAHNERRFFGRGFGGL